MIAALAVNAPGGLCALTYKLTNRACFSSVKDAELPSQQRIAQVRGVIGLKGRARLQASQARFDDIAAVRISPDADLPVVKQSVRRLERPAHAV